MCYYNERLKFNLLLFKDWAPTCHYNNTLRTNAEILTFHSGKEGVEQPSMIDYYINTKCLEIYLVPIRFFSIIVTFYKTIYTSTVLDSIFLDYFTKCQKLRYDLLLDILLSSKHAVSSLPQPFQAMLLTLLLSSSLIFSIKLKSICFKLIFNISKDERSWTYKFKFRAKDG